MLVSLVSLDEDPRSFSQSLGQVSAPHPSHGARRSGLRRVELLGGARETKAEDVGRRKQIPGEKTGT